MQCTKEGKISRRALRVMNYACVYDMHKLLYLCMHAVLHSRSNHADCYCWMGGISLWLWHTDIVVSVNKLHINNIMYKCMRTSGIIIMLVQGYNVYSCISGNIIDMANYMARTDLLLCEQ